MITRIQVRNFRSLRSVDQALDEFHAIVGPNGSGKSSFLDAFAFLSDVLRSGLEGAVFGDGALGVMTRSTDPKMLTWMGTQESFEIAVELAIPSALRNGGRHERIRYELGVHVGEPAAPLAIAFETLSLGPAETSLQPKYPTLFPDPQRSLKTLQTSKMPKGWKNVLKKTAGGKDYFRSETTSYNTQFNLGPGRSALAGLPVDETRFPIAVWTREFLQRGIQRIQLDADAMRLAAPPGSGSFYRHDGSNLAWVIDDFKRRSTPQRFQLWVDHVAVAVAGVVAIDTVVREDDRHRYVVVTFANGLRAPSWVLSDGTLRILALTLLAYLDQEGGLVLVEEPENGIHPGAIEAVVAALCGVSGRQVLIASHSPVVLGVLDAARVLCFAKSENGATDVVRGDQHPTLRDWKDRPDLGTLLVAGVLG